MMEIKQGWEGFKEAVIPKNASKGQIEDMQKAFYGGATIVLALMTAISDEKVTEEDALKRLSSYHKEIDNFYLKETHNDGPIN